MIRKKRVSFREDLVENIPTSFRPGLETNRELLAFHGIVEVFPFLIQLSDKITFNHNVGLPVRRERSNRNGFFFVDVLSVSANLGFIYSVCNPLSANHE